MIYFSIGFFFYLYLCRWSKSIKFFVTLVKIDSVSPSRCSLQRSLTSLSLSFDSYQIEKNWRWVHRWFDMLSLFVIQQRTLFITHFILAIDEEWGLTKKSLDCGWRWTRFSYIQLIFVFILRVTRHAEERLLILEKVVEVNFITKKKWFFS